ncbi:acyltransferase family protein [Shewanella intestini]|uniref:Acyltransferase family protein n=1 Tax=Shewanella intestini TaxID=2017544 RepID=A0ABS5I352_9GAMM|nr:acyltransferase family protein [Shewanella sp. XMDDZSB0408]MBR9728449.1 acyltransferase family protein [Shewanella intestini]MRG36268.1 acyltransferase family protein [Shewanella sp. XMDDZSB0408]
MLRNNVFDNTKLLMIFLVVFGHFIEPIISQSEVIKVIYKSIYSVHMPVFIIIAGAFTKLEPSQNIILKNIKSLIIPFFVFTILYEIFNILTTGNISHYTLNWQPYWILWFLLSLFIWKVTLPIIMQFKFPLTLSIFISLYAGYISDVGYFLGISRTLYFFPFFVLGYKLGSSLLSNNFLLKIPRTLYFTVLLANILVFWAFNDLPHQWLYGSFSYNRMGDIEWFSFAVRSIIYFVSVISSIAILMLVPNRESVLATRGQNSLFVYLWHGFFVKIGMYFGVMQFLSNVSNTLALFTLFISAILITALLSSAYIANITNKFLLLPAQRLLLIKS